MLIGKNLALTQVWIKTNHMAQGERRLEHEVDYTKEQGNRQSVKSTGESAASRQFTPSGIILKTFAVMIILVDRNYGTQPLGWGGASLLVRLGRKFRLGCIGLD
jgi:hypothetical protein